MKEPRLMVERVDVNKLRSSEYNPRFWDDNAIEQLTESIEKHGFINPLLANSHGDRKGVLLAGHFRLSIAQKLGYKKVPVIYIDVADLKKEQEINLRLNRNRGSWDDDLLKAFDPSFLLEIGFDDVDLSNIWEDALSAEDDNFDVEKEIQNKTEPVAKLGDKFQLGSHVLLCGDSEDPETIARLMDGKLADVLYTDPKYNIGLDYCKGISTDGKYGGTTNDKLSHEEYEKFLKTCLSNAVAVLKPDAHVFCYCDQLYTGLIQKIYGELGVQTKRVCLWVKNNFNMTPQTAFNKCYEPCVYGTIGKPYLSPTHNLTEILNKEISPGNRTLDDIVDLFDIWLAKRDPAALYQHPTQKPPTLHEKALRRCSKPGDIILDIFAGSGSLMSACEQMKRSCYMVEIEPIFCDVIISRYEQLTGKKAVKL